jgi:hypothetical protein
MKKTVCAAIAAILAGGLVCAQDAAAAKTEAPVVKVTGGFMSGIAVTKDGSDDAKISVWNTDIGAAGRAYLNFDLTGGNYGFSAQLRGQASQLKGTATTTATTTQNSDSTYTTTATTAFGYGLDMPYFKWVYGYADLFTSVLPVTVKGGILYEDIWGVGYEGLGSTFGYLSGPAAVVNIKPIQLKGLEFGAGIMDLGRSKSEWSDVKFSADYLTVGAKYTMENVFAVGAQYKFGNGYDTWYGDGTVYTDGALMASASLNCVKNLTLSAEGEITSIRSDDPFYLYDEYAAYKFSDKITADIIAMQFVTRKIYTFEPTVSYKFSDAVSVKLIGADFITKSDDNTDNDWCIMPSVTFTAGKAKIDVYYAYATAAAPEEKSDYNYYYYGAGNNIMLNYKFTF